MTTILFTFIIAFVLSLGLTPLAGWLGVRFGAVDVPVARKVHTRAIPRDGGLAIAIAFFVALIASTFLTTRVSDLLILDRKQGFAVLGGVIAFGVGFFDDFHRLGPRIKFLFQVLAASLAFYGGVRIEMFSAGAAWIHFGILSYFVTVFWFLLFINAINLIDGLDGLASGVAFFTSAVMVVLAVMQANYLAALAFAALCGALLGFLRYNFNPASIFMGDGGSYFIGYTIAALAILGSIKSQVGATLLIPLIALGVPIFDTILAPLRRFLTGRALFLPDKGHIHHILLRMGFTARKAVLLIYGASMVMCLLSIVVVNVRNEMVALVLIFLGTAIYVMTRKMGYLEYLAFDKLMGWLRDISDVTGIKHDRRSFLNLQMVMGRSRSREELWKNTVEALEMLKFDEALLLGNEVLGGSAPAPLDWRRNGFEGNMDGHHLFKIELPLMNEKRVVLGSLLLVKDVETDPISQYTLRRVEQLRRSLVATLEQIKS